LIVLKELQAPDPPVENMPRGSLAVKSFHRLRRAIKVLHLPGAQNVEKLDRQNSGQTARGTKQTV
jgi:hypothetical protein